MNGGRAQLHMGGRHRLPLSLPTGDGHAEAKNVEAQKKPSTGQDTAGSLSTPYCT